MAGSVSAISSGKSAVVSDVSSGSEPATGISSLTMGSSFSPTFSPSRAASSWSATSLATGKVSSAPHSAQSGQTDLTSLALPHVVNCGYLSYDGTNIYYLALGKIVSQNVVSGKKTTYANADLLYVSDGGFAYQDQDKLYYHSLASGKTLTVTADGTFISDFFSYGSKVYYLTGKTSNNESEEPCFYVFDADKGGAPSKIQGLYAFDPFVSGRYIYCTAASQFYPRTNEVGCRIDMQTGAVKRYSGMFFEELDTYANSDDWVVYHDSREAYGVMNNASGKTQKLSNNPLGVFGDTLVSTPPKGNSLQFTSLSSGTTANTIPLPTAYLATMPMQNADTQNSHRTYANPCLFNGGVTVTDTMRTKSTLFPFNIKTALDIGQTAFCGVICVRGWVYGFEYDTNFDDAGAFCGCYKCSLSNPKQIVRLDN